MPFFEILHVKKCHKKETFLLALLTSLLPDNAKKNK